MTSIAERASLTPAADDRLEQRHPGAWRLPNPPRQVQAPADVHQVKNVTSPIPRQATSSGSKGAYRHPCSCVSRMQEAWS